MCILYQTYQRDIYIMCKRVKPFFIRALKIFWICCCIMLLWFWLAFFNVHCRLLTFSMLKMAEIYKRVGTVTIHTAGNIRTVNIYKHKNKPFLLVGPYKFADGNNDFFFVSKNYVITTVTDKGSEWTTLGNYLLINDHMTMWDRLRMPFTYGATRNNDGIKFNVQMNQYDFKFDSGYSDQTPVSFSVPAKHFTVDMPEAELFLDHKKIKPSWIIRLLK